MQTKQIGIILLIGLLILGVIGAGIPYTTSQFIWQSTDLNYVKFYAGEYDGNGLIIDGNIFTIFDLNGGSGSFTDTNFETAGLTLTGSNTGDQDLTGLVPYSGATGNVDLGSNDLFVDGKVGIGTGLLVDKGISVTNSDSPSSTMEVNLFVDTDPRNPTVSAGFLNSDSTYARFFLGSPGHSISRLDFSYVNQIDYFPSIEMVDGTRGSFTPAFISTTQGHDHLALVAKAAYGFISGETSTVGGVGNRSLNYKTYSNTDDRYNVNGQYVYDTFYGKETWVADQYHSIWRESGTNLMLLDGDGNLTVSGETVLLDKLKFTQTDGNEFIDSLNDGYMDYGATTGHRFNASIDAGANDIQTTGSIKGIHKTSDGTSAVADGEYVMGLGTTTNGTITIKDGLIISVTEAVD